MVFVPVAPLSSIPSIRYTVFLSVCGNRSLPVPKNMYCAFAPTFTVAIELKIG